MTAQRPNVIVYQDFAELTVTPDTPDLDVLVVGPCYQILDYLDDKEDCYAGSDYGEEDQNWASWSGSTPSPVVLSDPPNVKAGGVLDDDSVTVFLDECRAVIDEHTAVAQDETFFADDNVFRASDYSVAAPGPFTGTHFGVNGIKPGDILLARTGVAPANDAKKVVKELSYVLKDQTAAAVIDTSWAAQGVGGGDTLEILNDAAGRDGTYTVKQIYSEGGALQALFVEIEDASNLTGSLGLCDVRVTSAGGTVKINTLDGTGCTGIAQINLQDWCGLRCTSEFSAASNPATPEWRIERELSDVELSASDISIDDNEITIGTLSGILVAVPDITGNKYVSYGKPYVEYKALRTDLQSVNTIENNTQILSTLGKYDSRNPLCVGATVAKANTTTSVKVFGIGSDDLTGYRNVLDAISTIREIYAIVPLTYNTTVLGEYLNMANSLANPNYVLSNGLKQKFRVILGALQLQTTKEMKVETLGAETHPEAGSQTETGMFTLTLTQNIADAQPDLVAAEVIPGDKLTIVTWDGALAHTYGPFDVAHVNSTSQLEIDIAGSAFPTGGGAPAYDDWTVLYTEASVNASVVITDAAGSAPPKVSIVPDGGATCTDFRLLSAALDDLYLDLVDPSATFLSDLVIPGDIIQIPENPESTLNWTDNLQSWVVDTVMSETRLRVVNNGNNTPGTTNELPHGYTRALVGTPPALEAITNGSIYYRVIRNLGKTEQVTEMLSVAQSFADRRLVLCYPDTLDISGLVDGSLTREDDDTPTAAGSQPGYYGACAVGGQTAGQPPQQGFTNFGVNGIDEVYFSNSYFNEEQLSDLSNGGVYVFAQDNPSALPYSIHELTTDVSSLETGEYMITKDFDYIAWTYLDTMWPFIGTWNITNETLGFIRQALAQVSNNLKGRYVRKIGAPLIEATITEVSVSDRSSDRIDAYIEVDLPMVLNTIALHLVAS